MTDEKATLPEGGEWATGSLLDKSNVGKYVHADSGRYAQVRQIAKVGRTNVHVAAYGRTISYRVSPDLPGTAHGEFNAGVQTNEVLAERNERNDLVARLPSSWYRTPTDKLRRIVAILDEPVA